MSASRRNNNQGNYHKFQQPNKNQSRSRRFFSKSSHSHKYKQKEISEFQEEDYRILWKNVNYDINKFVNKLGVEYVNHFILHVNLEFFFQTRELKKFLTKIKINYEILLIDVEIAILKACSHPSEAENLFNSVKSKVHILLSNEKYYNSFIVRVYKILTEDIRTIRKTDLLFCFKKFEIEQQKSLQLVSISKIAHENKSWQNLLKSLLGVYYAKDRKHQKTLEQLLRDAHGNIYFNFEGMDFSRFNLSDVCLIGSRLINIYLSETIMNKKTLLSLQGDHAKQVAAEYKNEFNNCQDNSLKLKSLKKRMQIEPQDSEFYPQKLLIKYEINIEEKNWSAAGRVCEKLMNLETDISKHQIWKTKYWLLKAINFFYMGRKSDAINCLNRITVDKKILDKILQDSPSIANEIKNIKGYESIVTVPVTIQASSSSLSQVLEEAPAVEIVLLTDTFSKVQILAATEPVPEMKQAAKEEPLQITAVEQIAVESPQSTPVEPVVAIEHVAEIPKKINAELQLTVPQYFDALSDNFLNISAEKGSSYLVCKNYYQAATLHKRLLLKNAILQAVSSFYDLDQLKPFMENSLKKDVDNKINETNDLFPFSLYYVCLTENINNLHKDQLISNLGKLRGYVDCKNEIFFEKEKQLEIHKIKELSETEETFKLFLLLIRSLTVIEAHMKNARRNLFEYLESFNECYINLIGANLMDLYLSNDNLMRFCLIGTTLDKAYFNECNNLGLILNTANDSTPEPLKFIDQKNINYNEINERKIVSAIYVFLYDCLNLSRNHSETKTKNKTNHLNDMIVQLKNNPNKSVEDVLFKICKDIRMPIKGDSPNYKIVQYIQQGLNHYELIYKNLKLHQSLQKAQTSTRGLFACSSSAATTVNQTQSSVLGAKKN